MARLFHAAVRIGDCWLDDMFDSIQLLADQRRQRLEDRTEHGYRRLVDSVRTVLSAKDESEWQEDDEWERVRDIIKASVRQRVEHVEAVREMFLEMNMTDDQAYTLTLQLMTDPKIADETRRRMVDLWWQARVLKPFSDESSELLLENGVCVVPDRVGKQLEFNNYVRQCLPLDNNANNLVRQLHTLHKANEHGLTKQSLLDAGGVVATSQRVLAAATGATTTQLTAARHAETSNKSTVVDMAASLDTHQQQDRPLTASFL